MVLDPYPWAGKNTNTSNRIAGQSESTYKNYEKIKRFEDVGYFLLYYVVSGGIATPNITRNDMLDVTDIVVSLNDDIMARDGAIFQTVIPSTTYYLDFSKDGDWTWDTVHPIGLVNMDYLTIAEVTTDVSGLVSTIIDTRTAVGGFRLKDEYGLDQYMEKGSIVYNVKDYNAVGSGLADDTTAITTAIQAAVSAGGGIVYSPTGSYRLTSNITVPSNVTVWFSDGAVWTADTGVTITINGTIDASMSRIFAGAGTINGSIKNDVVYPQWWGAVADGVTDATKSIQAALNTKCKVVLPYTDLGYKVTVGAIFLFDGSHIEGINQVTIRCTSTYLFLVQAVGYTISNLKIDMTGAPVSSMAIRLVTAARVIWYGRISKIQFMNCYGAIRDDAGAANYVVDLQVTDCVCTYTKGVQVYMHKSRGFVTFRDFVIDHTLNTAAVNFIGAVFEDFVGVELEKFDVVGPVPARVTPAYNPAQIGLYMKGTTSGGKASVWFTRVLVDNTMGDGIYVENVMNLVVNGLESYQNLGNPIVLKDITVAQITNLFVVGAKGLTGAAAGANGIVFNGCQRMTVSNLKSSTNTGIGVSIFNSTDNLFANVELSDNASFGWYESGTSNRNIVTGANLSTNTTANLVQSGAASAFAHWINSGAYRAHDVGVVTV
ncbi:hypothetical protein BBD42_13140 [Paenibacillus sp. BIHB 4019]|uniref:Pectate lyase superfamily protein domain-containing protein n=1 Tax=Paenibacillus sp. BIHB 4019 TaxID=1870819 RepID=A0A1B2DHW1_9BACL|nr:right-handed parallel beta-helix repeat-containing protein [Paenibacillus sp. BIHB 4019]ANY67314.1 hypothetical protein BBD42_13140 [Paenibacillus sp. BIHB 4019]